MELIVCFRANTSPCASTVIFCSKSPLATANATCAISRTWSVRFFASLFTLLVKSPQAPVTPLTSAWPPSLPSVPTSCATRVTSEAKRVSFSTMVLMVSFNSKISPRASTVIFWLRSPLATAVATVAILRTWFVRLSAIPFTLLVKSCQAPDTSATSALPPNLPSVPTSCATRVTSEANWVKRSTMVLRVFFNSRISPLASTVIFWLRSPFATAVATVAILRTWFVRLSAIPFTLLVRSCQTPATFSTTALPPRIPSVPTSCATRVTSAAKRVKRSTMVLIVSFKSSTSPCASTVIFWLKSPLATAVATVAILRTWLVRLSAIPFTLLVSSRQTPPTSRTSALPPSMPCVPTSLATRVTSEANWVKLSTIVLMVVFNSCTSPRASTVIFWLRSPFATAVATAAILRTWLVRLSAMPFTLFVKSCHTPPTFSTCALPPRIPSVPTSCATRVTSEEN